MLPDATRHILAVALVAGACAAPAPELAPLDTAALERILGVAGTVEDGEFKVTVPQNDLDVRVDGFAIVPPMGLGSWGAFTPGPRGAVLMGDLVVQDAELAALQPTLVQHGLTVTGLHNHFARETPSVLFMHIGGDGPADSLAHGLRAVLDRLRDLRGGDPAAAPARSVTSALDTAAIARGLGASGQAARGVYRITLGRPDVALTAHGARVSSFLGFSTWAAWQGTEERAAVAGDFAMLAHEVAPVVKALVTRGIEVVALHNHMTHEQPTIYFLHYWGVGRQSDLLAALQAALVSLGPTAR
ncbi:MAG: DUF1259 domain-containing protein [Gemmatimonadota bacterium]